MIPEIQLALGMILLSSIASYLCWSRLRVSLLRQELFEIRNELWDIAHAQDSFDDLAYRHARRHLNALIYVAPSISLPLLVSDAMQKLARAKKHKIPKSEDAILQKAVDRAYQRTDDLVLDFVVRRRVSGLAILMLVGLTKSIKSVKRWLNGYGPESLTHQEQLMHVRPGQPMVTTQ